MLMHDADAPQPSDAAVTQARQTVNAASSTAVSTALSTLLMVGAPAD